jgi:predicted acyltransferase
MSTKSDRLLSLDALRGFDMFWIIGTGGLWHGLAQITDWTIFNWWSVQMTHVEWEGFRFYDMIFPLFLFIAGISFPYSYQKNLQNGVAKKSIYLKILKRGLILVLLGFVFNGLLKLDFDNQRYASVLGRIGLAWMFAALIFVNTKRNGQIIWCAGLLIFYWLLLTFVQAPDFPDAARFSKEGNIASYIDRTFLPGVMFQKNLLYDPCGIMGTIPAISTALLGMLTGLFVKTSKEGLTDLKKAGYMTIGGIALIIIGLLWNLIFPINKPLWSSSYVCLAGGLSLLLFALFYWIIDVCGYRRWTLFFTVIGLNSITIYMAQQIINFRFTANYLFGGIVGLFPEDWARMLNDIAIITVCWCFLYFMYRMKIFIKV